MDDHATPLPSAVPVEREILGAMLLNAEAIDRASAILQPSDFYQTPHVVIFRALVNLRAKDIATDSLGLINKLTAWGDLERVGGARYVMRLQSEIATTANVEDHARIVAEHSARRQLIKCAAELTRQMEDRTTSVETGLETLRIAQDAVTGSNRVDVWVGASEASDELLKMMDDPPSFPPTGVEGLDERLAGGGLSPGSLTVIGGLTSHGKSALSNQIALSAAMAGNPVGIASYEMSPRELHSRLLVSASYIVPELLKVEKYRADKIWADQPTHVLAAYVEAAHYLRELPFEYWAGPGTVKQLCDDIKVRRYDRGCELVVVDYLQIATADREDTNERKIAGICEDLKKLARELDIPIILLSQFDKSTATAASDGKRPRMENFRDSGSVSQHADNCGIIWRKDFATGPSEGGLEPAEFFLDKQRNGAQGGPPIELVWEWKSQLFRPSHYMGYTQEAF